MSVKTATWTAWTPPSGKTITGYKIYSDIDGEVASVGLVLTTPITLSDGVSHNVTCRAVYNDASLGLVSNVEVVDLSSSISFTDDFTGVTVDAGKWSETNPDSGLISFVQNGELKCQSLAAGALIANNYLQSVPNFTIGSGLLVFQMDIKFEVPASTNPITKFGLGPGVVGEASSSVYFGRKTGTQLYFTGNTGGAKTITVADASVYNSFKIVFAADGETCVVYKWEPGDVAWSIAVATANPAIAGGWDAATWKIFITQASYNTGSRDGYVDNVFVANADYATQYPV